MVLKWYHLLERNVIKMAINKTVKARINLTIEHDLKAKVEELARLDERSTNSMLIKLIKESLQARENKEN